MPDTDDDVPADFVEAIGRLSNAPRLSLEIRPVDAWIMMGALQLALRHPAPSLTMRIEIERLARRLAALIEAYEPALARYAEAGFDPEQDVH